MFGCFQIILSLLFIFFVPIHSNASCVELLTSGVPKGQLGVRVISIPAEATQSDTGKITFEIPGTLNEVRDHPYGYLYEGRILVPVRLFSEKKTEEGGQQHHVRILDGGDFRLTEDTVISSAGAVTKVDIQLFEYTRMTAKDPVYFVKEPDGVITGGKTRIVVVVQSEEYWKTGRTGGWLNVGKLPNGKLMPDGFLFAPSLESVGKGGRIQFFAPQNDLGDNHAFSMAVLGMNGSLQIFRESFLFGNEHQVLFSGYYHNRGPGPDFAHGMIEAFRPSAFPPSSQNDLFNGPIHFKDIVLHDK